jgi:threonine dehydrogenase-like Zn-dependent dehydrogenase
VHSKQSIEFRTKLFVQKELDILGSRNATLDDFEQVLRHLEHGVFPVDDVITQTVPFAEAGAALATWDSDPTR